MASYPPPVQLVSNLFSTQWHHNYYQFRGASWHIRVDLPPLLSIRENLHKKTNKSFYNFNQVSHTIWCFYDHPNLIFYLRLFGKFRKSFLGVSKVVSPDWFHIKILSTWVHWICLKYFSQIVSLGCFRARSVIVFIDIISCSNFAIVDGNYGNCDTILLRRSYAYVVPNILQFLVVLP